MAGETEFRRVMGHFATGVTVVACRGATGEPLGLTVSAFTSVSLEPLLVLVCIHTKAFGHDPLLQAGSFGVSVLSRRQGELAWRFAAGDSSRRFDGVPFREGEFGSPLLEGALAWLECRVRDVFPGGDHSIILAEVLSFETGEGDPLLFFRGGLGGWCP